MIDDLFDEQELLDPQEIEDITPDEENPNASYQFSTGDIAPSEQLDAFMEEFADRLFYGIDICRVENIDNPMVRLAAFLDNAMLEGKISYDTYYKICRGNAEKLLGLV